MLNKLTMILLHQSIHYFCWTQPFVWKALSYVALVLYSTSSRWKQQPERSHVHSHSFSLKRSAHQRHWIMQIVFSCTSEHRKTHIWHERDPLSFVCGFSGKAAAPALLCLLCSLRFGATSIPSSMSQVLPFKHFFKKKMGFGDLCPARCCKQSSHDRCLPLNTGIRPCPCRKSLYFRHLAAVNHASCSSPSLAFPPVSDDSKSFSVTAFWRASSHISARPTHLSAEDKVVMICQDCLALETCHSRLRQHCGTQKRNITLVVMFM